MIPLSALSSEKFSEQGTFGSGFAFLEWLKDTNQSAWQLLPLHQTPLERGSNHKHIPSPYKSYGIGLDPRYMSLALPCPTPTPKQLEAFVHEQKDWLLDYALFCALRDHFSTDDWSTWPKDIRTYQGKAIQHYTEELKTAITEHIQMQGRLHFQYEIVRKKAQEYTISLIGDLPFYVGYKSPLVWAHQELFDLTSEGKMRKVSGIPDGPEAHFGRQIWGHALYQWQGVDKKEQLVRFWKMRLKYLAALFDWIRLDHAKGLFFYGVIDLEKPLKDIVKKGPGAKVLEELILYARGEGLEFFAEDSGDKIKELRSTLQKLNVPGIRILYFSIAAKKGAKMYSEYGDVPSYPVNTFACTTTHDTETLLGYLELLTSVQKKELAQHAEVRFSTDNIELAKRLRKAIIDSQARGILIPIQDWLLTKDRINIPGTEKDINDPNWQYKLKTPVEKLETSFEIL